MTVSDMVVRQFGDWLKRVGVTQISERDDLDSGRYYRGRLNVRDTAETTACRHPTIGVGLSRIGRDDRYAELAVPLMVPSVNTTAFMAPYIALAASQKSDPARPTVLVGPAPRSAYGPALNDESPIRMSRWNVLLALPCLVERLASAALILVFPLLNAAFLWRKGVRPSLRPGPGAASRKVLFVHRETELLPPENRFRDMYFLDQGMLDPGQCQHMLMATSGRFGPRKRESLEKRGGVVIETVALKPGLASFIRHVLWYPWRGVPILAAGIIGCPAWRWASTQAVLEYLHLMSLCPMILDHADGASVVFETEVAPMVQIMAIEARRRGRRAISMIHGSGAQHTVAVTRLRMQVAEMMVYGHWDDALRETSPGVERCIPVGNIEVDNADGNGACLPPALRDRRQEIRIVAFLARQSHVLTTDRSSVTGSPYLYLDAWTEERRKRFTPFFRWVASQPDVVLVWKAPLDGMGRFNADGTVTWQAWLAPLMEAIPPERFVFLREATLEDVVANADLSLCNDVSSAFACALSVGRPALSMDLVFGGMMARYHPRLVASDGDMLVDNLEWLLENPLPGDVFRRFNEDFYGMAEPDFRCVDRIKAFFDTVVGNCRETER